ncbi:hypothetical protein BDP27DRAFT_1353195 [Rhodocollybia butyracea]|uniref:Uncharacterized protein n=1 Tax=Rhodocollybia butyracea TaxID=206335 RepID=A0A9P5P098_9AGAR|nr:hypothetical protein BDP27DRAFT_1353195 [Rhodocollybia butyracea]
MTASYLRQCGLYFRAFRRFSCGSFELDHVKNPGAVGTRVGRPRKFAHSQNCIGARSE